MPKLKSRIQTKKNMNMPKDSKNLDNGCTFSSLASSYDHLYAMNDTNKTTLVCGTAICIGFHCLWGPTNKLDLLQLAVLHTHVVFLLYYVMCLQNLHEDRPDVPSTPS